MKAVTLDDLRRYAVARSLFKPTTLPKALARLGFVQADPMRAPARAQDLTLRHRVADYRAGDLERRYGRLRVEEDCLVNYGFLAREHLALMHPRTAAKAWDAETTARAADVLAFVREHGTVHPRDVDRHFAHGRVTNYWGGSSNATTHLLDGMHYRGLLRVAGRAQGTRLYTAADHPPVDPSPEAAAARARALVGLIVAKYAPLPAASLTYLVYLLRYGAPHLQAETRAVLREARAHHAHAVVDGVTWFWPEGERPGSLRHAVPDGLRLLAPFDPVVWDRRRFTHFWDWTYRFEAYTPAPQRQFGHYALPVLWGDQVPGWANLAVEGGRLLADVGHVAGRAPGGVAFRRALEAELSRMAVFLGLDADAWRLRTR